MHLRKFTSSIQNIICIAAIIPFLILFILEATTDDRGNVLRPHEAQLASIGGLLILGADAPGILGNHDISDADIGHGGNHAVLLLPPWTHAQDLAQVKLGEFVVGDEQPGFLLGLPLDSLHQDHVVFALPGIDLVIEDQPTDSGAALPVLLGPAGLANGAGVGQGVHGESIAGGGEDGGRRRRSSRRPEEQIS